jgi:hypothetical protein
MQTFFGKFSIQDVYTTDESNEKQSRYEVRQFYYNRGRGCGKAFRGPPLSPAAKKPVTGYLVTGFI